MCTKFQVNCESDRGEYLKDEDDNEYEGKDTQVFGSLHIFLLTIPHKFGTAGLLAGTTKKGKTSKESKHLHIFNQNELRMRLLYHDSLLSGCW